MLQFPLREKKFWFQNLPMKMMQSVCVCECVCFHAFKMRKVGLLTGFKF